MMPIRARPSAGLSSLAPTHTHTRILCTTRQPNNTHIPLLASTSSTTRAS
uniref:Uncharacterized protein n=1 Tax=Arundo donax TaxID=35708 RepID=A0A0A9BKS3_ARUDO